MGGLFLILFTLGALVGLGMIWFFALRRPAGVEGPECGSCGYRVEGLEKLACPECGSDLRTVGIVLPKRVFIHPILFILLWTILLPWPALLVTQIVFSFMPTEGRMVQRIQFTAPDTAMPPIELTATSRSVVPRGRGVSVGGGATSSSSGPEGWTSTLSPPIVSGPTTLETLLFELDLADAPTGSPLQIGVRNEAPIEADLESILPWIQAHANAAADDTFDAAAVAAELGAVLTMLAERGAPVTLTTIRPGGTSTQSNWSAGFPAWIGYSLGGFWLLVYVGGLVLFLRIHRRRVAGGASGAADPT